MVKVKILISFFVLLPHLCIAQQNKKVLIIGIDGCRPDALMAANTPNIDLLLNNAIYSLHALNDDITISGPGWSAMLAGVWSNKHGITNNTFSGSNLSQYPHFFKRVETIYPSLNTVSISQWGPINNSIVLNHADYIVNVANEISVTQEAIDRLTNHDPDVMFLQYDDVDHAGHASGFSKTNPAYIQQIQEVDTEIGHVLQALQNRRNYNNENWLILLSTDHGGINTSHGGPSIEEKTIFTIAHNKSFVQRQIFPDTVISSTNNCIPQTKYLNLKTSSDMVNIPNIPSYNFGANQDFTVECRVKTTTAADVAIVTNKNWDSGANDGFILSFKYANGPEWKANIGDGSNRRDINTGGSIANGEWHHLAASFDRDGDFRIFEDGVLKGSINMAGIGNIDNNAPIRIGADINGNYDFTGMIQEVRIWNKVVSPSTLDLWKCAPVTNLHPDINHLIGYWKLDDNIGTGATDYSTNHNDGTISGPSWENQDTTLIYTQTPRITDIAVTALHWLCIDPPMEWALDGKSFVDDYIKVSSLYDNTPGSLRSTILSSCPNDSIIFDIMTDETHQRINHNEISIPHDLTILGNGTTKTFLSGEFMNRIFYIPTNITLNLKNILLTKGKNDTNGGAFYNKGNLYLGNVELINNFEQSSKKSFTNEGFINVSNLVEVKE